jgi:hypothetical protein
MISNEAGLICSLEAIERMTHSIFNRGRYGRLPSGFNFQFSACGFIVYDGDHPLVCTGFEQP